MTTVRTFVGTAAILVAAMSIVCHGSAAAKDQPNLQARYALAERFLFQNTDKFIVNGTVNINWIGDQDVFWYARKNPDGQTEFVKVDARTGQKSAAFDHRIVAAGLAAATGIKTDTLPFETFEYNKDRSGIIVTVSATRYQCALAGAPHCQVLSAVPENDGVVLSPDGKWAVFSKDHNLWLRSMDTGTESALTTDGIEHFGYGAAAGQNTHFISDIREGTNRQPLVSWSPDSQQILTHRMDLRRVREMALTQSVPDDGSPGVKNWRYRGALGSDPRTNWPVSMPLIINVSGRRIVPVAVDTVYDDLDSNIELQFVWWSDKGDHLYFIERKPHYKSLVLHRIDPKTGVAVPVIHETGKTFVQIAEDYGWPKVRTTSHGDIIWYSERDGYGHLYRYSPDGKLHCQLTKGKWMVREIVRVDDQRGKVFFIGSGREPTIDPYFQQLYTANLDCSGIRRLTPEALHHAVNITERSAEHYNIGKGIAPFSPTNSLSASSRYFVSTASAPNVPPISVLRNADGKLITILETADISKLVEGGLTMPEPFSVLARDGRTRLYGTLFKPSYFDPSRRYPIIDSVYLGPQLNRVHKDFSATLFDWNTAPTQALAELGFIVMTFDSRGSPYRSKIDHNFSYGANISGSGNLIDHVDAIQSLAKSYSFIDASRVGAVGYSSGGYAAARALLMYPDMFKVGVAGGGPHDLMGYVPWNTTYLGPDLTAEQIAFLNNSSLASQLKGKLMLYHGEMDDNVHPYQSLRFADALMANGKSFDLNIVPGANHDGTAYRGDTVKRIWDYFIKHLNGENPEPYPLPDAD